MTENLIASVNRFPDRPALIFYGAEYTYAQMLTLVEQLSGHFKTKFSLNMGEPVFALHAKHALDYHILLRNFTRWWGSGPDQPNV